MTQLGNLRTLTIAASLTLGFCATFTLLAEPALAQDDQVTGVDFAVSD